MEIRETEDRRRQQANSDIERWSNKDGKWVGLKKMFGNWEGETKTDMRAKYECIQTSWR